ncbi:MAG: hypothetical protein NUW01_14445 [Gemmatimonadaceae bacterium]|nr:hypothetical protein [Gemmatimonadaceae bacterium]
MPGDSLHTLASELADLLRGSKDELVSRWLERISARVSLAPNKIFPTDEGGK